MDDRLRESLSDSESMDERTKAITAVEKILEPLCTFMVRNGVGFKEANDILKDSFLKAVDRDEFVANGRDPNVSRTAVLTGLSRKEISKRRRARAAGYGDSAEHAPMSLPARLLAAWAHDSEFHTSDGIPAPLGFPDGAPSFTQLLSKVGADLPPTALISELVRCGSVVWDGSTRLRMVRQSYRPLPSDDYHSVRFGECVRDLQNTMLANMEAGDEKVKLLERRAWTEQLPSGSLEHFYKMVEAYAETLLVEADAWLAAADPHGGDGDIDRGDTVRAGVGVYVFRD